MISSILGFITGNASDILKWTAIIAMVTLVGTVFNAFSEVGTARGEAKAAQVALKIQIAEAKQANKALDEVVDEYGKRDAEYEEKAKLAAKYRRRALFAERKLGAIVASGDTTAINERLCDILRSIEGNTSDSGETLNCTNRTPSDATNKYYKISEQSVVNMLANFERIRSYVDTTQTGVKALL